MSDPGHSIKQRFHRITGDTARAACTLLHPFVLVRQLCQMALAGKTGEFDRALNSKGVAQQFRTFGHRSDLIINENPNFVFIKVTKAAGTSILRHTLEKTPIMSLPST